MFGPGTTTVDGLDFIEMLREKKLNQESRIVAKNAANDSSKECHEKWWNSVFAKSSFFAARLIATVLAILKYLGFM